MPYFGDTASAPRIEDEGGKRLEEFWTGLGIGGAEGKAHAYRTITSHQYRLTCLTEAAAKTGAATGFSADTYHTETRTWQRVSADGHFQIKVSRDSWTDWARDTYAADT
jgi:hypothetical protein